MFKGSLIALVSLFCSMASADIATNWSGHISDAHSNYTYIKNAQGSRTAYHCNDVLMNGRDAFLSEIQKYYNSVKGLSAAEKKFLLAGQRSQVNSSVAKCVKWVSRMGISNVIGRAQYRSQIWALVVDKHASTKDKIEDIEAEMARMSGSVEESDTEMMEMLARVLDYKLDAIQGEREDFSIYVARLQEKLRKNEKFNTDYYAY